MLLSSRWACIVCGLWWSACVDVPEPGASDPSPWDGGSTASSDGGEFVRPPTGQPYTGPECDPSPSQSHAPVVPGSPGGANNAQAGAAANAMRDAGAPPSGAGTAAPDLPDPPDLPASARPAARGAVVITEIMSNPEAVRDDSGEWFELYNPSETDALSITGCAIDDGSEKPKSLTGELVLEPLAFAVVARSAEVGFAPDAILSFSLANTEDRLALICDGIEIDRVSYGVGYPLIAGASLALDPSASDAVANDAAGAWCAGTGTGTGDRGTPGTANPSCEVADAGS